MASAVKLGLGALLKRGSTTIPEVVSITINPTRDALDVTSHDSTAPGREFIAGLVGADVSFTGNFLPGSTNQKLLTTDLLGSAGTVTAWHISWPDGPLVWDFNAFVTEFTPTGTVDGKLSFSGKLKVTANITVN